MVNDIMRIKLKARVNNDMRVNYGTIDHINTFMRFIISMSVITDFMGVNYSKKYVQLTKRILKTMAMINYFMCIV